MKLIKRNLKLTSVFFLVRFLVTIVVSVIYILIAAAVQYWFVSWLGENTFNYIIGGVLSLGVGAFICRYLGSLFLTVVSGWQVSAIAYASQIIKKDLPPLQAGMTIFNKHLTSFTAVYGLRAVVRGIVSQGSKLLWNLLENVPYIGTFKRFSQNPIVVHVSEDIFNTGFDAIVYYIVRFTKPGINDDVKVVPTALRQYLLALPGIMLSSITLMLALYIVPKVLRWATILLVFVKSGFTAGILITVLLFPVFYVLRHAVFEPITTVILLTAYARKCKSGDFEEEESQYGNIVNRILNDIGFGDDQPQSGDDNVAVTEVESSASSRSDDIAEIRRQQTERAARAQGHQPEESSSSGDSIEETRRQQAERAARVKEEAISSEDIAEIRRQQAERVERARSESLTSGDDIAEIRREQAEYAARAKGEQPASLSSSDDRIAEIRRQQAERAARASGMSAPDVSRNPLASVTRQYQEASRRQSSSILIEDDDEDDIAMETLGALSEFDAADLEGINRIEDDDILGGGPIERDL